MPRLRNSSQRKEQEKVTGEGNGARPLSLVPGKGSSCPLLSGMPSQKIFPHVFQVSLRSFLHLVSGPSACQVAPCTYVSIPGRPVEFQNSKLQGPDMVQTHTGPVQEDLLGLKQVCPKRAVTPKHKEFGAKYIKEEFGLAALSRCLGKWCLSAPFSPRDTINATSPRCASRGGNSLSQDIAGDPQTASSAPRLSALLLHRNTAAPSRLHTGHATDFLNFSL